MATASWRRIYVRVSAQISFLLLFAVSSWQAHAQTPVSPELKRLLDANAWQLDYQISFKASALGRAQGLAGAVDYQHTLNVEYSETVPLDTRSPGASLSMQKLTASLADPAAAAQMQKSMMDLVMQTDSITSWMAGGGGAALGDDPSDAQLQAFGRALVGKAIGKMTLDYTAQTRGDRLVNESGSPYKQIVHTAKRGTAGVPLGGQQIILEVNAAAKRVSLALPAFLAPLADATYTEEVVTSTEMPPGSAPVEKRETNQLPLNLFPGTLKVTEAAARFRESGLLIDDPIALTAGKISGQRTTKASYDNAGTPIEGTLAVKYTLTPR